jgi:DNA-binding LytR/AlgR family response regulator
MPLHLATEPVGAVHAGIKVIERACDALAVTIAGFLDTPEQAERLHDQLEGEKARLAALSALALARVNELIGRV